MCTEMIKSNKTRTQPAINSDIAQNTNRRKLILLIKRLHSHPAVGFPSRDRFAMQWITRLQIEASPSSYCFLATCRILWLLAFNMRPTTMILTDMSHLQNGRLQQQHRSIFVFGTVTPAISQMQNNSKVKTNNRADEKKNGRQQCTQDYLPVIASTPQRN